MTKNSDLGVFLHSHLEWEFRHYFGVTDEGLLDSVTEAWLDDETNSQWRYAEIARFAGGTIPPTARILDMACGCGTFVYLGLRAGLDVWGIDPEGWKLTFNHLKAHAYGYPDHWKSRFVMSVGETLPFPSGSFDYVSSYQTLEHVQNVEQCLQEMLRVLRPGGVMFLRAPDYWSTFEGHYRLPWLPLFPRPLAERYLKVLNRPVKGLSTINPITTRLIKTLLRKRFCDQIAEIVEPDTSRGVQMLQRRFPFAAMFGDRILLALRWLRCQMVTLFRKECSMNLIVVKNGE